MRTFYTGHHFDYSKVIILFELFQIVMANWEDVFGDIDWDKDFDSDSSDIEDYFPGLFLKEDQFNLSITTNDLIMIPMKRPWQI